MKKDTILTTRIYPVLFMAILTLICILPISGIFLMTEATVMQNEALVLRNAVLHAADLDPPSDADDFDRYFSGKIAEIRKPDGTVYYTVSHADNGVTGYVFILSGPGLWGEITAAIGFDKTLTTLTGIDFTSQNETPGLGARITEMWFKEQFRGRKLPVVMVPEKTARTPGEVDAITGATRTSDFVLSLVNGSAAAAVKILGEK